MMAALFGKTWPKKRRIVEIPDTDADARLQKALQKLETAHTKFDTATKILEEFIGDFKNPRFKDRGGG